MIKKLNNMKPLPGPKWVNWGNLITSILIAIIIAGGSLVIGHAYTWVQKQNSLPKRMQVVESRIQALNSRSASIQSDVKDILQMMKARLALDKVFIGQALISNAATNGDAGVWLNENSKISQYYKENETICVTVLANARKKCNIPVLGVVSVTESNVLLEMTRAVARLLRTDQVPHSVLSNGNTCISIKVEPNIK